MKAIIRQIKSLKTLLSLKGRETSKEKVVSLTWRGILTVQKIYRFNMFEPSQEEGLSQSLEWMKAFTAAEKEYVHLKIELGYKNELSSK